MPRGASGRPHLLTLSTPLHPEARGGGPKCAMPGTTGKSAQCFCAAMHICVPSAGGTIGDLRVCRLTTTLGEQLTDVGLRMIAVG